MCERQQEDGDSRVVAVPRMFVVSKSTGENKVLSLEELGGVVGVHSWGYVWACQAKAGEEVVATTPGGEWTIIECTETM